MLFRQWRPCSTRYNPGPGYDTLPLRSIPREVHVRRQFHTLLGLLDSGAALSKSHPCTCVQCRGAIRTIFMMVFDMTRPGREPQPTMWERWTCLPLSQPGTVLKHIKTWLIDQPKWVIFAETIYRLKHKIWYSIWINHTVSLVPHFVISSSLIWDHIRWYLTLVVLNTSCVAFSILHDADVINLTLACQVWIGHNCLVWDHIILCPIIMWHSHFLGLLRK